MPKRTALHIGELPVWRLTKSPRIDRPDLLQNEIVTATADSDTTKLLNERIRKDQQARELTKARMARYRGRIQDKDPMKKQKIRDSITVWVPKAHDLIQLHRERDLTRMRTAKLRDRSRKLDSVEQQALEAEARKR
jgi:hypothetical protein